MIITPEKGKIVQRIARTKTGELVAAVFWVSEHDGALEVVLLSVALLSGQARISRSAAAACLSGSCREGIVAFVKKHYRRAVSPYVGAFEFFTSQPIRAPSQFKSLRH